MVQRIEQIKGKKVFLIRFLEEIHKKRHSIPAIETRRYLPLSSPVKELPACSKSKFSKSVSIVELLKADKLVKKTTQKFWTWCTFAWMKWNGKTLAQ